MQTILYTSESRGAANYGWLNTRYSFSFANYYHPERIHFGVLRVLNDDLIAAGGGFPEHPHDNMEIITIPLSGALAHKDSMGNSSVINAGEVQVMSAGSGIFHSEFNHSKEEALSLFQIWLFPNKKNVEPRYDQISLKDVEKENEFYQVLSPNKDDQGVWIHQDAWFYMGNFTHAVKQPYHVKEKDNGVYIMLIDGEIKINGQIMKTRDAIGIWDTESFEIDILSPSKLLVMDIPMR